MTFTELVQSTRENTTRNVELLEERVVVQEQIFELEDRLEAIEAELIARGYTL